MDTKLRTSHARRAKDDFSLIPITRMQERRRDRHADAVDAPSQTPAPPGTPRIRRLIADQRYFGIPARAFHAGAQKMLNRISVHPRNAAHVDLDGLGTDFQLDHVLAQALLDALLDGGLLIGDGEHGYRATARFREYAAASLVAPLSRARAKLLIESVRELATQINVEWLGNPFEIKMVTVSGSYMSRRDHMPDLSLYLVLRSRQMHQGRRWRSKVSKGDGLRQILTAVTSLSSFILARIIAHKSVVPRPFSVVFEANAIADPPPAPAHRLREWGASLHELLSAGSYASPRRGRSSR